MAKNLLIIVVLIPLCLGQETLQWECQCYKTQKDCTDNKNGIPFVNLTLSLKDRTCKHMNLSCYDRHFRSFKQGIRSYKGDLLFVTADYCDYLNYGEYNDSKCNQQEIDVKVNMIGCYTKYSPNAEYNNPRVA